MSDEWKTGTVHLEILGARHSQAPHRPFQRLTRTDLYLHYRELAGDVVWLAVDGCRDRDDDLRARHEAIMELANLGLDAGWLTHDALVEMWLGRYGDPAGSCPQLGCEVAGPLDAVAKWMRAFKASRQPVATVTDATY